MAQRYQAGDIDTGEIARNIKAIIGRWQASLPKGAVS